MTAKFKEAEALASTRWSMISSNKERARRDALAANKERGMHFQKHGFNRGNFVCCCAAFFRGESLGVLSWDHTLLSPKIDRGGL
jgi:hypothetical protein